MAAIKTAGPSNVGTRKKFNNVKATTVDETGVPNFADKANTPANYTGQVKGRSEERFAKPMNEGPPSAIRGMEATHNDIGELSGFITDGYLDKQGTAFGEAAKLNFLPPGMDISNQVHAEINEMPLRQLVGQSYPGDGWMPSPRDIPE